MVKGRTLETLLSKRIIAISFCTGVVIHSYSELVSQQDYHVGNIVGDFSDGRFLTGVLKTAAPFIFPYAVSLINYYSNKRNR